MISCGPRIVWMWNFKGGKVDVVWKGADGRKVDRGWIPLGRGGDLSLRAQRGLCYCDLIKPILVSGICRIA